MEPFLFSIFTVNKRRIIATLFLLLLGSIIVSCNLPQNSIDTKIGQGSTETINIETSVEKGQQIVTDLFEITIDKSLITKEADSNDLGTNIKLSEKDGNIYFILIGTVKNISSSAISFTNLVAVDLSFDEKYEYEVSSAPSGLSNVVPLKSESFVWYASVPIEIFEAATNYKFEWDLLSGDDSVKEQAKYSFSGLTSQYWSVENIDNFHTFTEYISYILPNDKNITALIDEKDQTIIIKSKGEFQIQIADGTFREYNPRFFTLDEYKLYLDYKNFKNGEEYGEIEMRFYISNNLHAFPTDLSFSSDAETINFRWLVGKSTNNFGGPNQHYWYLHEFSSQNRFEEFYRIISGNSARAVIHYRDTDLEIEDAIATVSLPNNISESINRLLLIYSVCPKTNLDIQ